MGRFVGGLFAAFALTFCVASTAQAAEIPPTPGCLAAVKAEVKASFEKSTGKESKKQQNAETKRFAKDMEARGCISDAKPLYVNMPAIPFSDECFQAAADAEGYFDSANAEIEAASKPFITKVYKPFKRRSKSFKKRIKRLARQHRTQSAQATREKLKHLREAFKPKILAFTRKYDPLSFDFAYNSSLIEAEFVALRCMSKTPDFDSPPKGPVAKVMKKYGGEIFGALLYLVVKKDPKAFDDSEIEVTGSGIPSKRSAAKAVLPFDLPR